MLRFSVLALVVLGILIKSGRIMRCLRAKSAAGIVATLPEFFKWDLEPIVPFPPVVEPPHEGAFLPVLPLIIAATSEEGLLKTARVRTNSSLLDEYKQMFERIQPFALQYDHHAPVVWKEITQKIGEFYFKDGHTFDKINHPNFTDVISDAWFITGIIELIRQRVAAQTSLNLPPFYVYSFEQRGAASFAELFAGGSENFYGACHADDFLYFYPIGLRHFVSTSPTANDVKFREAMLQMWVNFATEGNPTTAQSDLPRSVPVTGYPVNYAQLGQKNLEEFKLLEVKHDSYGNRMNF